MEHKEASEPPQAAKPGPWCCGKQHVKRWCSDPGPLAPVRGHKEQNGSSPPLPKTYVTEDAGSRKEGVVWNPQQLHHHEEGLLQFKKNVLSPAVWQSTVCLHVSLRIRELKQFSWHLIQQHNVWQMWTNRSTELPPVPLVLRPCSGRAGAASAPGQVHTLQLGGTTLSVLRAVVCWQKRFGGYFLNYLPHKLSSISTHVKH